LAGTCISELDHENILDVVELNNALYHRFLGVKDTCNLSVFSKMEAVNLDIIKGLPLDRRDLI